MLVREIVFKGAAWRGTASSSTDDGPSTRTCKGVSPVFLQFLRLFHLLQSFARDTTYAFVVDDLNNGSGPANVWAGSEEHDTADLDESPVASGPVWQKVLATASI